MIVMPFVHGVVGSRSGIDGHAANWVFGGGVATAGWRR